MKSKLPVNVEIASKVIRKANQVKKMTVAELKREKKRLTAELSAVAAETEAILKLQNAKNDKLLDKFDLVTGELEERGKL